MLVFYGTGEMYNLAHENFTQTAIDFLEIFCNNFIAGEINEINFNTGNCRALKFILYLAGAVRICINKMRENMEESYDNC